MAKSQNFWITAGAAVLGLGAVTAHHVSEGRIVDNNFVGLLKFDVLRGIAFGAGGGAAVALVTKAPLSEMLSRMFVGGLMAAVAAPYIAENILSVPTNSTSYPVLCCSIGVLGFQMIQKAVNDPSSLPVVGRLLGSLATPSNSGSGGPSSSPPPLPPVAAHQPSPAPAAPAARIPVADWVSPAEPAPRPSFRIPLAR